jgi:hemoglobin/transferrin/lactoferrin receptor protein
MRLTNALCLTTILSCGFLFSNASIAQSNKPLSAQKTPPVIVVTPTKSDRAIDRIPFAVSVVKKNDLTQGQPQSIDDALKEIPNFESAGGPRRISEEPSLRGLSDRRIVIKVDGIRRNFRGQYGGRYFLDPMLIDRVEIVRGANSAIDGSGAVGGVMQFFTPQVQTQLMDSDRTYGVESQVGFQTVDDEFSFLTNAYTQYDKVDLMGAVTYRATDNVKVGGGDELVPSSSQPDNALMKAGFNIGPKHRAELRFARFYDESDLPVSPFQPAGGTNLPTIRKSGVTDYSFHYRLAAPDGGALDGLFDLTSIIYRSDYSVNTLRPSPARFDETDFTTFGLDTYNTANLRYLGLDHRLTTGVEYFENEQFGRRNGGFRPLLGDGKDKNLGVYLQQETTLWNRLTLTPGIRFDHYELTPQNAALAGNTEEQFSPKLGLDYQLNDNWSWYASYGTAFRTPTLTELYATGLLFPGNNLISNPNLRPETAENKEIGIRYKGENLFTQYDNLKIATSVFRNDIDNYIEQVIEPATTQFRNVSQAELTGFEIEAKYRVDQYSFGLVAGTIRGENKTANQPLSDVPQNKLVLTAERTTKNNELMYGVRLNHYAEQDRIPTGQPLITTSEAANTVDIYGTWTPNLPNNNAGQFRVNFGVDNVTDENYRRQLAFVPESGRNVKVTLNWKF